MAAGASVNESDTEGNTPFLICCSSGRKDVLEFLLQNGADPTARNSRGENAFSIAEFHNHLDILHTLDQDSPFRRFGK